MTVSRLSLDKLEISAGITVAYCKRAPYLMAGIWMRLAQDVEINPPLGELLSTNIALINRLYADLQWRQCTPSRKFTEFSGFVWRQYSLELATSLHCDRRGKDLRSSEASA